jgi:hypothetical protein
MPDSPKATELPEGFVFHGDCIVPISDVISRHQYEALCLYLEEYEDNLKSLFSDEVESGDLDEEDLDWVIEDFAFELLFPHEAKQKNELEHSLALIAYEKRGLGSCCSCVSEANEKEGENSD